MDPLNLFIIFISGLLVSIVTGVAGGGIAIFIIPLLTIFGLPIQVAIATQKFGNLGSATTGTYRFGKDKKIIYKYAIPVVLLGMVGAAIGAQILIEINQEILSILVGIVILALIPIGLFGNSFGLIKKIPSKVDLTLGYFIHFINSIYGGFFGAGGGFFSMYTFIRFFGLDYLEANATLRLPWLASLLVSVPIFAFYGLIEYDVGVALILGTGIGGYIGSHIALKKGSRVVRIVFTIISILMALKLILFP
ncbi:sulfite exporter TauE/SafE family protein [Candidatus Micrarchaeota archaeon]|nr:sulfite exporter TauE/SafE family protein [Candidatus Micrarchaeota archaeon]